MKAYRYECTDTFGGEANYSWVKRGTVTAASDAAAVRRVKSALGFTGWRCKRDDGTADIVLRPYGACIVVFIDETESVEA